MNHLQGSKKHFRRSLNFPVALIGGLIAVCSPLLSVDTLISPEMAGLRFVSEETPEQIMQAVEKSGYEQVKGALFERIRETEEGGAWDLNENWLYWYLWVDLWSRPEQELVERWIKHDPVIAERRQIYGETLFLAREIPFGQTLDRKLKLLLLRELQLSREFFALNDGRDHMPRAMAIFSSLYRERPKDFKRYLNLAMAIALVHDVPPPANWPHRQVTSRDFPRQLSPFLEVFDYFVNLQDSQDSRTNLRLASIESLTMLVDLQPGLSVGVSARRYAENQSPPAPASFADIYNTIGYRHDRVRHGAFVWPHGQYTIETVRKEGGLCVDQAFYSFQVGKLLGYPTILFLGHGLDGRHAWFGYCDDAENWNLDAGRFDRARFITGYAQNPRTWQYFNDHEILFLEQVGGSQSAYSRSLQFRLLAEVYWRRLDYVAACRNYRQAIESYAFNLEAWNGWIGLVQRHEPAGSEKLPGSSIRKLDDILESALMNFSGYPDLEMRFIDRLRQYLESTGNTVDASILIRHLTAKNRFSRSDIAVRIYAAELLEKKRAGVSGTTLMRDYRVILSQLGPRGGTEAYDRIVRPFIVYLMSNNQDKLALEAAKFAREKLRPVKRSQLDHEMEALITYLTSRK